MLDMPDEFETALAAIAKMEGKSIDQVKLEMLKDRLGGGSKREEPRVHEAAFEPRGAALTRSELGDASGAIRRVRSEAIATHNAQEFPGTPVVRHRYDHGNETAEEARERWEEEETELIDGVHGLGGQSAGGIFGDGAVATSMYDPMAHNRADGRLSQQANIRTMRVLERMENRLDQLEGRRVERLGPGGSSKKLTRGNR